MADDGRALPDGSFPIANVEDLRNAIQAIGRAKDRSAAIAHIKKRARELDQEDLIPEDWDAHIESLVAAGFAPGTKDGPGWITHPIPTARIRRYWVRGEGAAKIRWGTPGSFNRCRAQLAKYVQNPEWLAGLCANMYKEATGRWPGVQRGDKGLSAASAIRASSLLASAAPALEGARVQSVGVGEIVAVAADGSSRQPSQKVFSAGRRLEMTGPDAVTYSAQVVEVQTSGNGAVLLLEGEDVRAGSIPSAVAIPVSAATPDVTGGVNEGADLLHSDEVLELRLASEFRLPVGTDSPVVTLAHSLAESARGAVAKFGVGATIHTGHTTPPAPLVVMASAERTVYPASAFEAPREGRAFAMRIDREARTIVGYAAEWGSCHIGIAGMCQQAPASSTDYSYFRKGVVDTDQGEQRVGLITAGIGHAGDRASAAAATAHYDQTDAVRAYINIGEDQHGIWYAGVLAPFTTDAQIDEMRAIGRVSGDWRSWSGRRGDLEMVGLVCVNTEGFQLAASGGIQTAAIGIGALPKEEPEQLAASAATPGSEPLSVEAELVEFDIEGMATTIAEKVPEIQERRELVARAEAARASVRSHQLAHARAKLTTITKE